MNYSYFVGLDVGKKSFDASLMSLEEEELSHRSFANTERGIRSLLAWVKSHVPSVEEILFCAENMGSYVTTLCVCSQQLSFSLALECPLTIKKSIGLQRGKNDRIDARRIASYTVLHHRKLRLYRLPDKELVQLRNWIIIRDNLVKQKVSSLKLLELTSRLLPLQTSLHPWHFYRNDLAASKRKYLMQSRKWRKLLTLLFPL